MPKRGKEPNLEQVVDELIKECENCKEEFIPKRTWQTFCSYDCRMTWHKTNVNLKGVLLKCERCGKHIKHECVE